jgi:hypothetical protein
MAIFEANENKECNGDEHSRHLCYFVSYGYHVENPEDYKALVEDPRYKCYLCGRVAHNAESLCMPKNL